MSPGSKAKYNPLATKSTDLEWSEDSSDDHLDDALKPRQGVCSSLSVKVVAVLLVFIVQSGLIVHLHRAASRCQSADSGLSRTFQTQFGNNLDYQSLDHKFDSLWNETDKSVIVMSSIGVESGEDEVGAITMLHQLHCLASVRKALQNAREGQDIGIDSRHNHHWPHCLDYLRNAILCNGDDTIERQPHYPNGTVNNVPISGYQDTRTCRDVGHIYKLRSEKAVWT